MSHGEELTEPLLNSADSVQANRRGQVADITACPACGERVSTEATVCPHCGQPGPFEAGSSLGMQKPKVSKSGLMLFIAVAAFLLIIGRFLYRRHVQPATTSFPTTSRLMKRRPVRMPSMSNWLPEAGTMVIIRKNALVCPSKQVLQSANKKVEKASADDAVKRVRRAIHWSITKGCRRINDSPQGQVTGSSNVPEPMFRVRLSDGNVFWIDRAYLMRPDGTT